ncbi:MAG: EAL domain-containing protein [Betaproteobacteria bacterium]|nr:MAG: EAL domain-containing protein [Betaproteobacteria bacterium]
MRNFDTALLKQLLWWIESSSPPMQYQKKVRLIDSTVFGYEALLRAKDKNGRLIDPTAVLNLASKVDLREQFERATLLAVVRDIVRTRGITCGLTFAVNVSTVTVQRKGFAKYLTDLLAEHGIGAEELVLELTEDRETADADSFRSEILQLQSCGIDLSIDDFGQAYSGLERLTEIPIAEIKLGRDLVSRIETPQVACVIGLVKRMADEFCARLVAEGIETETQRKLLIESGVSLGQGFLFGRAACILEEPRPIAKSKLIRGVHCVPILGHGVVTATGEVRAVHAYTVTN